MKSFCSLVFSFLFAVTVFAVPAKSGIWRMLTLADGTQVKAELKGDEFFSFWKAEDGLCYVKNEKCFARISKDEMSERILETRRFVNTVSNARSTRQKAMVNTNALLGHKKGLVILVEFDDVAFSVENPLEYYNRFANEENFSTGRNVGSVSDYFKAQSNGQFVLDFDVIGPVKLAKSCAYYGANPDKDTHHDYARLYEFVAGALGKAASSVNWSDYDWNNDGEVDQVFFIFAGYGEADTGMDDTIWPHEFSLSGLGQHVPSAGPISYGKIKVNTYACASELSGNGSISGIGTMCHEFAHCLGYKDLYDGQYTGRAYGMGSWDLMHSGSYNMGGYCPPNFTAYEKALVGWKNPIELKSDLIVNNLKSSTDYGDTYIIYNEGHKNEYYMIENRQQTGWDKSIAAPGLLISHIDYDDYIFGPYYYGPNTIIEGSNDHDRVTIFHADNKMTEYDEEGDPYPFGDNNSLANNTVPAAFCYNANTDGKKFMNCKISKITQNNDGTMSFVFGDPSIADKSILISESFDKCNGNGGNDGNFMTFRTGDAAFDPDMNGWTCAYMGGASRCAKFGSSASNATVTSPSVNLTGMATLSFRVAPYAKEGKMLLNLKSDNSAVTFTPATFQMEEKTFINCTSIVNGSGLSSIIFAPDCRIYLDEIILQSNSSSGISEITNVSTASMKNYTIMGTAAPGNYKGIVIRGGKKYILK